MGLSVDCSNALRRSNAKGLAEGHERSGRQKLGGGCIRPRPVQCYTESTCSGTPCPSTASSGIEGRQRGEPWAASLVFKDKVYAVPRQHIQ